jgi:myo-inositol 2-dehydrogenase/D-chiro-inositol 1-dehydrogenase
VGLNGAGRIGSFHAGSVARRLVRADLVAIADPAPGAAAALAAKFGVSTATTDVSELLADPSVDAVQMSEIATPGAETEAQMRLSNEGYHYA